MQWWTFTRSILSNWMILLTWSLLNQALYWYQYHFNLYKLIFKRELSPTIGNERMSSVFLSPMLWTWRQKSHSPSWQPRNTNPAFSHTLFVKSLTTKQEHTQGVCIVMYSCFICDFPQNIISILLHTMHVIKVQWINFKDERSEKEKKQHRKKKRIVILTTKRDIN